MMTLKRLTLVLASALSMHTRLAAAAEPSVTVTSSPRILYKAIAAGCGPNFIPDSPARAFRRADGNVELIAAHFEDWMMIGRNFESLKPSCKSIMDFDGYHRKVPGQLWIQATYTLDGRHIEGLISQDLSRSSYARVMGVPTSAADSIDNIYSYPSLIDPESSSNNFDTLDHDTAILVFSVHHLKHGVGTMNRDIEFTPIRVR